MSAPLSHRHDPETSRQAAIAAAAVIPSHEERMILVALERIGDATNEEIAEASGLTYMQVVRRMAQLRVCGFVYRTGTKPNHKGLSVTVWGRR